MDDITLPFVRYEAIIDAALEGNVEEVVRLDTVTRREAGVVQYILWVRWSELRGRNVPQPEVKDWPEKFRVQMKRDVPFERSDVEEMLKARGANPIFVHVTSDPDGDMAWFELDQFDWVNGQ